MPLAFNDLLAELKVYAPPGVDLPRNPDTNAVREETVQLWADDAAQQINARRGITTIAETEITTVEAQDLYALPSGARGPVTIARKSAAAQAGQLLDAPNLGDPALTGFGALPSGQSAGGAIDLIRRQNVRRRQQENDFEIVSGKLRLLFPTSDGEKLTVRYHRVDRDLTALPDDLFTPVLIYLRLQLLEWYLGKYGTQVSEIAEGFTSDRLISLRRERNNLNAQWVATLNGMGPEPTP